MISLPLTSSSGEKKKQRGCKSSQGLGINEGSSKASWAKTMGHFHSTLKGRTSHDSLAVGDGGAAVITHGSFFPNKIRSFWKLVRGGKKDGGGAPQISDL